MTSQRKMLTQSPDADRRKVDNGIPIPDLGRGQGTISDFDSGGF
jgi:hypothetical protein